MKKMTLLIILSCSTTLFAQELVRKEWNPPPMVEGNRRIDELIEWNKLHPGVMPPLTEYEKQELFIKDGIPLPGSGVHIVDKASIKATNEQKSQTDKFIAMQKTKGYFEKYNEIAVKLLDMPEHSVRELQDHKKLTLSPEDTHLREVKIDLPMNYDYQGIPNNLADTIYGYAPESALVNDKWNAAVEYFKPHFKGICAYHENNLQLSQSAAYIPKEVVKYLVNGKTTVSGVSGNKDSGYVYEVEWWDKKFKRNLECASKEFSQDTRDATIELAKRIDSEQS